MKRAIFIQIFAILLPSFLIAQVKFYSDAGTTEISGANCETKNLMVRIPVTEDVFKNEFCQIMLYPDLSFKGGAFNGALWWNRRYTSKELDGKKHIDVWWIKDGEMVQMEDKNYNIKWRCSHDERQIDQAKITFGWRGIYKDGTKKEMLNTGEVKVTPQFNSVKYPKLSGEITVSFGASSSGYSSSDNSFSFPKSYGNMKVDFAKYNLKLLKDDSEESVSRVIVDSKSSGPERDARMLKVHGCSFPSAKLSIEETKADIVLYMKRASNDENVAVKKKLGNPKVKDWKSILGDGLTYYYPGYAVKPGKNNDDQKKAIEKYGIEPQWVSKKVGNVDAYILEFEGIYSQFSDENDKLFVKKGYFENTRHLKIFVAEKGGKIFVGSAYDQYGKEGLAEEDKKFFETAFSGFKAN